MYASRGLVLVHDKGGVSLAFVVSEVFCLQRLARFQLDFGKGDFVQFAKFNEAVAEASSVDDDGLVCRGQGIHDGGFHTGGTRTRNKDDPGVVGGLGEFLDQALVLEHQFRKIRRAEIGNLLCTDGAYGIARLYRTYCKVDHNDL